MYEMVMAVRDEMKVAYPELVETADLVSKVVLAEEDQFARVIERGWIEFEAAMKWPASQAKTGAISELQNKKAAELLKKYVSSGRPLGLSFDTELSLVLGTDVFAKYESILAAHRRISHVTFPGDTAFNIFQTLRVAARFHGRRGT